MLEGWIVPRKPGGIVIGAAVTEAIVKTGFISVEMEAKNRDSGWGPERWNENLEQINFQRKLHAYNTTINQPQLPRTLARLTGLKLDPTATLFWIPYITFLHPMILLLCSRFPKAGRMIPFTKLLLSDGSGEQGHGKQNSSELFREPCVFPYLACSPEHKRGAWDCIWDQPKLCHVFVAGIVQKRHETQWQRCGLSRLHVWGTLAGLGEGSWPILYLFWCSMYSVSKAVNLTSFNSTNIKVK